MTSLPKIEMEWQSFEGLSTDALYDVLRFRQSIFVVEQGSPYPDLDGLDQNAWHLLARAERGLVGYIRLITRPLRIGRVGVAVSLRHRGLGRSLIEEALRFCGDRYPAQDITLAAQAYLVAYYRRFGFEIASGSYDDFGVTHVEMRFRPTA